MSEERNPMTEGEKTVDEQAQADAAETAAETAEETAAADGTEQTEGKKKKSVGREILSWVLTLAVAVGAALLIRTFVFEPVRVDGRSMNNTLQDGEFMLVTKYNYLFSDPERFDVVICHYPERGWTNFVKRIVGVPGDTIAVKNSILYVNGEAIDETSYIDNPSRPGQDFDEITLGENEYFVMGDNRSNSNDSRYVGTLKRSMIKGQVRFVWFPFSQARLIK